MTKKEKWDKEAARAKHCKNLQNEIEERLKILVLGEQEKDLERIFNLTEKLYLRDVKDDYRKARESLGIDQETPIIHDDKTNCYRYNIHVQQPETGVKSDIRTFKPVTIDEKDWYINAIPYKRVQ
jgi:hypothetical protein